MTLGPRPALLRVKDVARFYGCSTEDAEKTVARITPCGVWGKDMLYPRYKVEKSLEDLGLR